tara:strand:+ start:22346 stop:22759 length:414 start_codon:yes stop_codon:yes gene_type:complete
MNGIKIIALKKIKTPKGDIYKFLSKKDKYFKKFGEIYFSEIKKKQKKGWNYHVKNKCHISIIAGKVKFHFLKKKGKFYTSKKIILSAKNYKMLIVQPQIYFSFLGLGSFNLIVNFLENAHSLKESKKFKVVNKIAIK